MEYAIFEYTPDDYPEVISLWSELGLGGAERGDNMDIISHTIACGGKLLLLFAKQKKELIGTSWLTNDGRRTYLHHFGIKKSYQGKGLSNKLLDASLASAKQMGMQIKLEVHKNNEIAGNLYRKAGFAALGDYEVLIIRDISSIQ